MSILKLTAKEEAVFIGNLLGDGHVQKRGNSYRTQISHSDKQKEYLFWKYEQLKRVCTNHKPKLVTQTRTTKTVEERSYLFYLDSGSYLKKYHDLFYQPYIWKPNTKSIEWAPTNFKNDQLKEGEKIRYKKVITQTLIELLDNNPLILAVWFLDNGSCPDEAFSGRLATQGFSKEEHHLLREYLKTTFDINTQIVLHSRVKQQYILSIPAKNNQFSNFVDIIKPIVDEVPTMAYKIKNPRND